MLTKYQFSLIFSPPGILIFSSLTLFSSLLPLGLGETVKKILKSKKQLENLTKKRRIASIVFIILKILLVPL